MDFPGYREKKASSTAEPVGSVINYKVPQLQVSKKIPHSGGWNIAEAAERRAESGL